MVFWDSDFIDFWFEFLTRHPNKSMRQPISGPAHSRSGLVLFGSETLNPTPVRSPKPLEELRYLMRLELRNSEETNSFGKEGELGGLPQKEDCGLHTTGKIVVGKEVKRSVVGLQVIKLI